MKNIVLIGHMSSGKTMCGKILAARENLLFIDSDELIIQKYGADSILKVYTELGEEEFRLVEESVISEINPERPAIIATGAGAILSGKNRAKFTSLGEVIYLIEPRESLIERILATRERFQGDGARTRLNAIFDEREPLYREIATVTLSSELLLSRTGIVK